MTATFSTLFRPTFVFLFLCFISFAPSPNVSANARQVRSAQDFQKSVTARLAKIERQMFPASCNAITQATSLTPDSPSIPNANSIVDPNLLLVKRKIYPRGLAVGLENDASGPGEGLEVLCDFTSDGGGWTTIQKRSSGPKEEFFRGWDEYEKGFGLLDGNFWLGLTTIRALTVGAKKPELRVELTDWEGEMVYAHYDKFSIGEPSDFYRLTLGEYSGTAGDSMTWNNGSRFSTKDQDHDGGFLNCSTDYHGSWWYSQCSHSNLNGLYRDPGEEFEYGDGLLWWHVKKSGTYSLKKVEMKIR